MASGVLVAEGFPVEHLCQIFCVAYIKLNEIHQSFPQQTLDQALFEQRSRKGKGAKASTDVSGSQELRVWSKVSAEFQNLKCAKSTSKFISSLLVYVQDLNYMCVCVCVCANAQ